MKWEQFFKTSDIQILFYLHEHKEARYSQLHKIIEVRSVLSRTLQDLQKRKLIERTVEQTHPIQTRYRLTDRGMKAVQLLNSLQELVE